MCLRERRNVGGGGVGRFIKYLKVIMYMVSLFNFTF